jgi:hypothetical protein
VAGIEVRRKEVRRKKQRVLRSHQQIMFVTLSMELFYVLEYLR